MKAAATNVGTMSTPAKLGLLGCLYFSQGLPFGFFTQALPVLLRKQGFSLGQIGLSSLLVVPWALKFLWAPAVDRWSIAARRKTQVVDRAPPARRGRGPRAARAVGGFAFDACADDGHPSPEPAGRDPGHRDRRPRDRHARAPGARSRQRPPGGRVPGRHDRRRWGAAHPSRSPRMGADVSGHGRPDRAGDGADRRRARARVARRAGADRRGVRISSAARARRACCCCWSPTRPATRSRPACCARSSRTRASRSRTSAGCSAPSASSRAFSARSRAGRS